MVILRSAALFVVAALFEIGGAWLVWQGVREHRGWLWSARASSRSARTASSPPPAGRQLRPHPRRVRRASSWPARSLWGVVADGYRPDRWDITGALVCLAGMAVIMWAPRNGA